MKRMKPFFVFLAALIFLSSCAKISYQKVDSADNGDGLRFYHSSPYLLVHTNGKGGLVTQVLFIADPEKKVAAKLKGFFATSQTTIEFDKGVYKTAKTTVDATAIPVAIIKAIQTAAPSLLASANDPSGGAGEKKLPPPHLYKIIVDGATVSFVGGEGDTCITVNLLPQEEKKK